MCVLTSVRVYLCEHVCVSVCQLVHFATMSGTQVLQELKMSVRFSTGRCVNLMYPFLFHLFAVTNLILHVCNTGSPRGDEDVGEVAFHADPVFVRFDVTAFPTPTEVTFAFLGSSANGTGSVESHPTDIFISSRRACVADM